MVLEDDAHFIPDFISEWNVNYAPHIPKDTSMIYLGGMRKMEEPDYDKHLMCVNKRFSTFIKSYKYNIDYERVLDGEVKDVLRRWYFHTAIGYVVAVVYNICFLIYGS